MEAIKTHTEQEHIWTLLESVKDPEIPVISVCELGIVKDVIYSDAIKQVIITPTYSGCPATKEIEMTIRIELDSHGYKDVEIISQISPAWTTDWITEEGRKKLLEYGIVPPVTASGKFGLMHGEVIITCPRCNSSKTKLVSEFGSTACKALYKCEECLEPFDYFKCI